MDGKKQADLRNIMELIVWKWVEGREKNNSRFPGF